MRTVQVIASRGLGGAEGFFSRLCPGLAERGCAVHAVLRQGAALAQALAADIPRSSLPLRTVWDPLSRLELRRELERLRPDLVQTWMSRATRLTRVPRGGVHVARLGGYYKPAGFAHADALVVNSRGLADHLLAAGLPARRVHLIGNFVDPPRRCCADELARLRAGLPLPADAWLLLAVGRCVPVKGWDVLLSAFARLPAQIGGRPPALVLLGDGPLRPALQAQAERLGVGGRVHFAGWADDPAPFYALADLVVFPSRPAEALGNVILETWAQGRPLLTTANRGARELVRPGIDALQVPCEDVGALAGGIGTLLADEAQRAALAAAGRARAARDFGREAVIGAYLDLYRQLLGI
ncbi:glycosyltransferase [Immundisolibacter sp.]|uniref:glycosyltransferase n=1 Tax=Immundisolibacter sp. TaxID=1934948 RepID=UPI0026102DB7|nr:glycosyltransferase [Immundisolibacter sp.]MDD3651681.1 glycosyltransferase [Immundisolibacter sp.]